MGKLIMDIETAVIGGLATECEKQGITIDAYANQLLKAALLGPHAPPTTTNIDIGELLNQAVARTKKLPIGREFNLEDLFSNDEWDALQSGERKSFGRRFKKAVAHLADHIGRTSGNKAIYKRR